MALFAYGRDAGSPNALFRLQQDLKRAFESPFGHGLGLFGRGVRPAINIFKQAANDDVVIVMEVPGFSADDISVENQGQTLVVSGKSTATAPVEGAYHRRERVSGEFSRSIQLPRDVDPARAAATCKNGVLTLVVPAREEVKPRQIHVTGGQ